MDIAALVKLYSKNLRTKIGTYVVNERYLNFNYVYSMQIIGPNCIQNCLSQQQYKFMEKEYFLSVSYFNATTIF